jgi:hypothetical protein
MAVGWWRTVASHSLSELITEHARWFDVVFIFSDNGDGLVLLIERDAKTDPQFLAACRHALATV